MHPGLVHHIVNTLGWPGLRPLQGEAIEPLLDGSDAVLPAPTAGGKTEAASFPLLSKMAQENRTGTSVLYVCPLKALLTTPESLEAMLVSANVDHRAFFSGLRAIVVDEVHAFAGDDRGWHLLAVLERLQRVVGRPVQRIGHSATVGSPEHLLAWLQGSGGGHRPARVVAPQSCESSHGSHVRLIGNQRPGFVLSIMKP